MIDVSIIIIVKNDRNIQKTLSILSGLQTKLLYEIIVIDASDQSMEDIKERFPLVRWITYKRTKVTSIPEQRNEGVKHAKGKKIVFLDSGCEPQHDWLTYLLQPTKSNELIVAGKVLSKETSQPNTIQSFPKNNYVDEAATANMLIDKEVFTKIGLFDTNFQCGEDVDFCWRANDNNIKIFYQPKAIVLHDYGRIVDSITRAIRYGEARIFLYNKHRNRIKNIPRKNLDVLLFPFLGILLITSILFPLNLLVFLVIGLKNINNHPLAKNVIYTSFGIGVLKGLAEVTFRKK